MKPQIQRQKHLVILGLVGAHGLFRQLEILKVVEGVGEVGAEMVLRVVVVAHLAEVEGWMLIFEKMSDGVCTGHLFCNSSLIWIPVSQTCCPFVYNITTTLEYTDTQCKIVEVNSCDMKASVSRISILFLKSKKTNEYLGLA